MIAQSESLTDKFDNICRLCLKEESSMLSIFATTKTTTSGLENEQRSMLAARITSIAQVQISPDDGLPAFVCQECQREVDKFYEFRLLVEISDRTLRSCFDRNRNGSEARRIIERGVRIVKNTDYEEYATETESPEDERELFAVNAILVPSASGMEVWQICSAEEDMIDENESVYKTKTEEIVDISPKIEYNEEIENSSSKNIETMESPSEQLDDKQSLQIKKIEKAEPRYFSTKKSERIINCDANVEEEEEDLSLEEYDCQICLKSFESLEALKDHVSDHFLGDNKRIVSRTKGDPRKISMTNIVENETELEKAEESEKTKDNNCYRNNDDEQYFDSLSCQSCDELFETMEERILHGRRNTTIKGPKCRYCGKSFLKLSSRNYHEQSIHEQTIRENKITNVGHKCDDCGKEFVKKSELRYHKGTHTSLPPTCTICNKHFRNVQSFKMHVKRHTLGSRYNCIECGKSYYTNSELARHIQQHTGTREYPCHLCDMSFLSKPELNRHFKYHNGEKKFECKLCRKTYYESGHLKVHERVHTGERPFSCTVCQKGFITKSKLVRHLKIHDRVRGTKRIDKNTSNSHQ